MQRLNQGAKDIALLRVTSTDHFTQHLLYALQSRDPRSYVLQLVLGESAGFQAVRPSSSRSRAFPPGCQRHCSGGLVLRLAPNLSVTEEVPSEKGMRRPLYDC